MLLEKVIEATVDVRNPINFCSDRDHHLMAALRAAYVGRCYMGAFIVRIKAVLQSSACRLVSTNSSGEGVIDVQFVALVAVFSRWDILVGVVIARAEQMVIGTHEAPADPLAGAADAGAEGARAVVTLLASEEIGSLAVGQQIPVRVVHALHAPMQRQAAVVGKLLVCDRAAPAYRLRGVLDAGARAELAPLLERVELELAARAALVAARRADVWFFELLLCSHRLGAQAGPDQTIAAWEGGPAWEGPPAAPPADSAKTRSVVDIVRRAVGGGAPVSVGGVWTRPLALYRSSPLACCAPAAAAPADWGPPLEGAPRAVFAEFLRNILDFLTAVREMVTLYDTRELIESHHNLWTVMRKAQTP